ncbi:MAG: hypothetical protein JST86_07530 [Bacteroidetes bacterium]|nr:hypothetical protein [Bacteroidota bacterium]
MKPLLFLLVLFCSLFSFAQTNNKTILTPVDSLAAFDSAAQKLNASFIENQRITDSINMEEFNKRNISSLNAFMAERKEQEQKAQTRMYWRLTFGAVMLVVLGVGLARKKKAASDKKQ